MRISFYMYMFSYIRKKERFFSFKTLIVLLDDKRLLNHHFSYKTVNSSNSNSNIIVIVIFETELVVVVVVVLSLFFV